MSNLAEALKEEESVADISTENGKDSMMNLVPKVEKFVKVRIGDLKPNPCRGVETYVYDENLLADIKASIEKRGYLPNMPVRMINGEYVLAAGGHHRLKALQEFYSDEYEVSLPLVDGNTEDCLIDMAQESFDGARSTIPRRLVHTVRQVRIKLLELFMSKPEELKKYVDNGEAKPETISRVMNNIREGKLGTDIIERFMNQNCSITRIPRNKVKDAVRAVRMADEGKIDLRNIDQLKNSYQLKMFLDYVKDNNTPLDEQEDLVENIADGNMPTRKTRAKDSDKEPQSDESGSTDGKQDQDITDDAENDDEDSNDEPFDSEDGEDTGDVDTDQQSNGDVVNLLEEAIRVIDNVMPSLHQVSLVKDEAKNCSQYKEFKKKIKSLKMICDEFLGVRSLC